MNLPNLAYVYLSTALPTNASAGRGGAECRDVRLRLRIRRRDPADDAGDRARQIPDGALCVREFADESGPDDPGHGEREDPDGARLPELLHLGAAVVHPGADSGAVHPDSVGGATAANGRSRPRRWPEAATRHLRSKSCVTVTSTTNSGNTSSSGPTCRSPGPTIWASRTCAR